MNTLLEVGVATTTSFVICSSVSTDNLLTALITFGVSLVTVVGGELIKYLTALLKKKTKDLDKQDTDKQDDKKEETK